MDAIKDIPSVDKPLQTEAGIAKLQKTDIFRKLMWFSYNNDNDWHSITCDRVKEIQELNSKGVKVFDLQHNEASDLEDLAAQSTRELELLDKKFAKKKRKKKPRSRPQGNQPETQNTAPEQKSPAPERRPRPERQGRKPNPPKNVASENPSTPSTPQGEAAGNQENKKRRNKRRKPRNPQNPNSQNQGAPAQNPPKQAPQNQQPKASGSTEVRPNGPKKEGKRRFPPRKNQNPNNNSGNE